MTSSQCWQTEYRRGVDVFGGQPILHGALMGCDRVTGGSKRHDRASRFLFAHALRTLFLRNFSRQRGRIIACWHDAVCLLSGLRGAIANARVFH